MLRSCIFPGIACRYKTIKHWEPSERETHRWAVACFRTQSFSFHLHRIRDPGLFSFAPGLNSNKAIRNPHPFSGETFLRPEALFFALHCTVPGTSCPGRHV